MKTLSASALALILLASPALACEPQVSDAWAKPSMAGKQMSAAFLDLRNAGETACTLTGVSVLGAVGEIHTTIEEQGVFKMRHLEKVTVDAGETVRFMPKDNHIMLMHLSKPLAEGGSTLLTLHFADGQHHTVTLPVKTAK